MIVTHKRKQASNLLLLGTNLNVLIPSNTSVLSYLQTSPGYHRLNLFSPKLENSWGCYTDISITTLGQTPFLNHTLQSSQTSPGIHSPCLGSFHTSNTSKLEDTQKFALRIFTRRRNMGYQDLLELTNCPTLHNRRLYLKRVHFSS